MSTWYEVTCVRCGSWRTPREQRHPKLCDHCLMVVAHLLDASGRPRRTP